MKRLAIALLVLFALSACTADLPYTPPQKPPGSSPGQPQVSVEYVDGAWKYAIEANVPTPCHGLNVDGSVAESYPERISLILTVTKPSANDMCPQVVDRASVEGSVEASEYASMTITFEGKQIYQHNARTPPGLMPPDNDFGCATVYEPVCGQPPFLPCPPGPDCLTVDPDPRTYPNACVMQLEGAVLIHEGECDGLAVI